MPLSSLSELKAAIIAYAMRGGDTDFEAAVPTFISLTEEFINSQLRVGAMETTATLTLTNGQATLPSDYLQFRSVVGLPVQGELSLITPAQAITVYGANPSGVPRAFTINGTTLKTFPSGDGNLTLAYFATIPALTEASPTNWLLQRYPGVYLYGALAQSEPFLMNDPRLSTWGNLFQTRLDEVSASDQAARYSRAASRIQGATP